MRAVTASGRQWLLPAAALSAGSPWEHGGLLSGCGEPVCWRDTITGGLAHTFLRNGTSLYKWEWQRGGGGRHSVASGEAEASESLVRKHQDGCVQFIEKQCPKLT